MQGKAQRPFKRAIGVLYSCCKVTLLSGLLLSSVPHASAVELINSCDFASAHANLQDYVVTPFDPNNDQGMIVAGNYGAPSIGAGIQFGWINAQGKMVSGTLLQFKEDDVRAISLVTIQPGLYALTVQARSVGINSHIAVLTLDASGNVLQNRDISVTQDFGRNLFPTHSLLINDQLYICGYAANGGDYPNNPLPTDDKSAFVIRYDMGTQTSNIHYFQTNIDYTPPPPNSGWNNLYNDYDRALRLCYIHGKLYVVGSANGSAITTWSGPQSVNIDKAWVSELDQVTLAPVLTGFFGSNLAQSLELPSTIDGYYAVDMVDDQLNPGNFYCVVNDIFDHTPQITHLDASLTASTPAPGAFNTVSFGVGGATWKGNGIFQSVTSATRLNMYGMIGSSAPFISPIPGSVTPPSGSAVPFVIGLDLNYSGGLTYSSANGNALCNAAFTGTGFNYQADRWTNAGIDTWCNPPFSIQADPLSGSDELFMMGNLKLGMINPRAIRTDGNGAIPTCISPQQLNLAFMSYSNMDPASFTLYDFSGTSNDANIGVSNQHLTPDNQYDCASSGIFSGVATLNTATGVKGIYPNPATDRITILLNGAAGEHTITRLVLTDVVGREVLKAQTSQAGNEQTFMLPKLTPGIYQASVSYNDNQKVVYKVVIE